MEETTLQELENEPKTAVIEEGKEEVKPEGSQEDQKEDEPQENRYSKRVKELNTKYREEQRARQDLEERLAKIEEANKLKAEPDPDKYDDLEKYRKDQRTWNQQEIERIRKEEREKIKQEQAKAEYLRQIEDGKKAYIKTRSEYLKEDAKFNEYEREIDDIVDAYQAPDIQDFILSSKETGPAVVKYLGTNPDELAEIASLSPQQRAFRMGQLVSKLAAKPVKKVSSAPNPVRTEVGSAPRQTAKSEGSRHRFIPGESFHDRAKRLKAGR